MHAVLNPEGIRDLLGLSAGARFWACDLHVHTPISADWPGTIDSDSWDWASELVAAARATGLDVVAITDHHTVDGIEAVRHAAAGEGLHVLPGVEIATPEGHITAIFDTATDIQVIRDLLIQEGFTGERYGITNSRSAESLDHVAVRIKAAGGIAILAHVESSAGLAKNSSQDVRRRVASEQAIDAVEVTGDDQIERYQSDENPLGRAFPVIQSSDSWDATKSQHSLDAIGRRRTFLKMDTPSLDGIRTALLDPDVRVNPKLPDRPENVVEAMHVAEGFLGGTSIRLSDGLTCLIGSTGSGKSLCLELIRYVLDQRTTLPRLLEESDSLLDANAPGGSVDLIIRKGEARYLVERALPRADGAPPVVYEVTGDGVCEPRDIPILASFFPLKAYSQSEIIEFARNPSVRMSLIDDLVDTREAQNEIREAKSRLVENAVRYCNAIDAVRAAEAASAELPGIEEDIDHLKQVLTDAVVSEHQRWQRDDRNVQRAIRELRSALGTLTEGFALRIPEGDLRQEDSPNPEVLSELEGVLAHARGELSGKLADLEQSVTQAIAEAERVGEVWGKAFTQEKADYETRLAQIDQDGAGLASLSRRLSVQEGERDRLLTIRSSLDEVLRVAVSDAFSDREILLTQMLTARRAIRDARIKKADELTDRLDHRVILSVDADADNEDFLEKLSAFSRGSRTRSSDLELMTKKLHPVKFVKSMIDADYGALSKLTGVSEQRFERMREHMEEDSTELRELLDLQLSDERDVLQVKFRRSDGSYRPVEQLAHGERCAVILMIAMAEGDAVLLVDQPEDALHPPLIEEQIVGSLRGDRLRRQHIFATRNANVVVSGDAEQTVGLEATAIHAEVTKTGSIDRFETRDLLVYHLEGGRDAFDRKTALYSLGRRN